MCYTDCSKKERQCLIKAMEDREPMLMTKLKCTVKYSMSGFFNINSYVASNLPAIYTCITTLFKM